MYQFDFVSIDNENEYVITILAPNYKDAVKKMRNIGLPGFDLTAWQLEGVYEIGSIIPNIN